MTMLSVWLWIWCVHWFYDDINSNWICFPSPHLLPFLVQQPTSYTSITLLNIIENVEILKYFIGIVCTLTHSHTHSWNISIFNFEIYNSHSSVARAYCHMEDFCIQFQKFIEFLKLQLPNWVVTSCCTEWWWHNAILNGTWQLF